MSVPDGEGGPAAVKVARLVQPPAASTRDERRCLMARFLPYLALAAVVLSALMLAGVTGPR